MADSKNEASMMADQQAIIKTLQGILENIKKNPTDRRTQKNYITKKLEVEEILKTFQRTDAVLRTTTTTPEKYGKLVEQLNILRKEITSTMEKQMAELTKPPEQISINPSDEAIGGKINPFEDQKTQWIEEMNRQIEIEKAKLRQQAALQQQEIQRQADHAMEELQRKMIASGPQNNQPSNINQISLADLVAALNNQNRPLRENSERKLKLPAIEVPKFNGEYSQWRGWKNLYTTVVHNNTEYSSIEKFSHLKSRIGREASEIVKHLDLTEDNYHRAWAEICDRYDNERLLVSAELSDMFNAPPIRMVANEIKHSHDVFKRCQANLESLMKEQEPDANADQIASRLWQAFMTFLMESKMEKSVKKELDRSLKDPTKTPEPQQVIEFLRRTFTELDSATGGIQSKPRFVQSNILASTTEYCQYCDGTHNLQNCRKYLSISAGKRWEFIKERKICGNCMTHKFTGKCHNPPQCNKCNKGHNSTLHESYEASKRLPTGRYIQKRNFGPHKEAKALPVNTLTVTTEKDELPFLPTAIVHVESPGGKLRLRALIDQGSHMTLIKESAVKELGLPRYQTNIVLSGVGQMKAGKGKTAAVNIIIKPHFKSSFELYTQAIIMKSITGQLPGTTRATFNIDELKKYQLADPQFWQRGDIDLLIGNAGLASMMSTEKPKSPGKGLKLQLTEFGWIISGPEAASNKAYTNTITASEIELQDRSLENMERFWEVPDAQSDTHDLIEEHYVATTKRMSDGKFMVKVPMKEDKELGESYHRALGRLRSQEKKLMQMPKRQAEYRAQIEDYINTKHMIPARNGKYYIPHQAVIKEDSLTTPLRVVFDASAKSSNNKSYNDVQFKGNKLQADLPTILLRFRKHPLVILADVQKMYRQIKITEEDQQYHHVLWRETPDKPVQEYKLTTVTFGTASAPYLALRTIKHLASEERNNYPFGAELLENNFYVDDALVGFKNAEEAKKGIAELNAIMKAGGFKLRKWASNDNKLLEHIPTEDCLKAIAFTLDKKDEAVKTLGIQWDADTDQLFFKVEHKDKPCTTKRQILSAIAGLYDPLGVLAPVTTNARIMMQDIWREGVGWDDDASSEIQNRWNKHSRELMEIQSLRIPRWIGNSQVQLIGFCDASEKAFGSVIYCRTLNDGSPVIRLVTGKCRVAPVKNQITLPRLELLGALLMAELFEKVFDALKTNVTEASVLAFCDSKIALAWIQGDAERWKTFVANRVQKIQKILPTTIWHYVPTKENPADMASRGLSPTELINNKMWWEGPQFIQQTEIMLNQQECLSTDEEEKKTYPSKAVVAALIAENDDMQEILDRFSSWTRMKRTIALCFSWFEKEEKGKITTKRLKQAENAIIAGVQRQHFLKEMRLVREGLSTHTDLKKLHPELNKEGDWLLRVGGRLKNSSLPYDARHPIIIPKQQFHKKVEDEEKSNSLAKLLVNWAHQQTLHGGPATVQAYLEQKYHLISAKAVIAYNLKRCVVCRRHAAKPGQQLMGDLPSARVTPAPAFLHCTVDYAGPFNLTNWRGKGQRTTKGYFAIFVCMATKAYHLEAVSNLTSELFIQAFLRFVSRRGLPATVRSDNGGNFVKGNKVMAVNLRAAIKEGEKALIDKLKTNNLKTDQDIDLALQKAQQEAAKQFSNQQIKWEFNPPYSPHFGGLHEAGVKCVKTHLKKVMGETRLTHEEFSTLLAQIEAILNSRPLVRNENGILTPGHFLIGRPITALPEPNYNMEPIIMRWKLVQQMMQKFWKTWSQEYLQQLQTRKKWTNEIENLRIADIVLIKELNQPPTMWKMAKIVEVHPGKDELTRTVTLQDSNKRLYDRAVATIVPLPVREVDNEITVTGKGVLPRFKNMKPSNNPIPPRRSKRIISKCNLLTVLVLLMTVAINCTTMVKFQQINQTGLHLTHEKKLAVMSGTIHVEIQTNLNVTRDVERVMKTALAMKKCCLLLAENRLATLECPASATNIQHHAQQIANEIKQYAQQENTSLHSRKRRSLLSWLYKVLIQSSEEDAEQNEMAHARRTSGLVSHAVATFSNVEQQITNREKALETAFNNMGQEVEKMASTFAFVNKNTINIYVMTQYTHCKEMLEVIQHNYDTIVHNPTWTTKEIELAIEGIRSKLMVNQQMPPITMRQLIKMASVDVQTKEDQLVVEYEFPIIDKILYEEIKINIIPDLQTNRIGILPGKEVIGVNINEMTFFYNTASRIPLTDSMDLVTATIVRSAITDGDCVTDVIFKRNPPKVCQTRPLDKEYDIWIELPKINSFLFYSTAWKEAFAVCNGTRTQVPESMGIIQIAPGCSLSTHTKKIHVNSQITKVKTHEFVLEQLVTEEPVIQMSILDHNNTKNLTLEPIKDDMPELMMEAAINEATLESVRKHPATFWTLCGITGILAGLVYAVYRRKQSSQSREQEQLEQNFELSRVNMSIPAIELE